ncbi:MAG: SDR family NAD(P)-dependent oxidoreductase [Cyclobacteriaceae bacterium]|nr:SDR family NAD(P)-dependent oxidoreductase [Cyclobacteriaceae bacterium]
MAEGRFDNPVVAALNGFFDLFRKQKLQNRLTGNDMIDGRTCLVTGANSGLGFAIAVELARRGGHVIMACRRQIPEAGEKVKKVSGSGNVEMRYLDLSELESIHSFCEGLKKDRVQLDITILNAGVALPKARETSSGQEEMFMVNYLSNVIVSSLLLKAGVIPNKISGNRKEHEARILFISSDSHQGSSYVDYDEFGKFIPYGVSKGMEYYSYFKLVANTFFTELSRRLNAGEVDVGIHVICPGPVNTNIVKEAPWLLRNILKGIFSIIFRSPAKAAEPVVYLAVSDDFVGRSNEYLHMFNPRKMDPKVYEVEEGIRLWEKSMELWKSIDKKAIIPEI